MSKTISRGKPLRSELLCCVGELLCCEDQLVRIVRFACRMTGARCEVKLGFGPCFLQTPRGKRLAHEIAPSMDNHAGDITQLVGGINDISGQKKRVIAEIVTLDTCERDRKPRVTELRFELWTGEQSRCLCLKHTPCYCSRSRDA